MWSQGTLETNPTQLTVWIDFKGRGKRAAFVANKRALVVWDFYYWYLRYLYLKLREGVTFILNAVIQSFRCLTVAVNLEAILENFSKLFCRESSASWDHQNTECCGLSGLYGEAAEKSLGELSHFSSSVPSHTEWAAQGLSSWMLSSRAAMVLGGITYPYITVMVWLFRLCL